MILQAIFYKKDDRHSPVEQDGALFFDPVSCKVRMRFLAARCFDVWTQDVQVTGEFAYSDKQTRI